MKYAIFEKGGKQYKAVAGETVEVDLMPVEVGTAVDLDQVLLISDDGKVSVGAPTVSGALVKATVHSHIKGPKNIIFKYRSKKHYSRKTGHRQKFTILKISEVIG